MTQYIKNNILSLVLIVISFIIIIFQFNIDLKLELIIEKIDYKDTSIIKIDSVKELTLENLFLEIKKDSLDSPEIVLAQAVQECGWDLNSYNARKRNNLFGFRNRNSITKSNPLGNMYISSWPESVLKYKKLQKRKIKGEDYYHFLKRIGYAEDSTYNEALVKKVYIIKKKFNL
jgi:hypothetical protein